jgi:hypothetical protein
MGIFEDKVRKYNERMKKDLQLNDVHTCGIWGNMYTETGGFKHLQELKPVVKGSRGGYGWMQWTGPRRKKYEAWAQARGLNVADDETNYLYFVQETLTDEWKSLAQLRKTTTLDASTETFAKLNLRPGVLNLKHRLEGSRKAADALKSNMGTKAAAVVVAAGGAATAATYTPVNYLPYIAAGLAVIGVIAATIYFMKGK